MTSDGLLRHTTFKGLRDDKPAREVELEEPQELAAPKPPRARQPPASDKKGYVITHPDKVMYPELGITKQELLDYYALVAERMLPQVANRPLSSCAADGRCKPAFFKSTRRGRAQACQRSIREKESKSL